MSRLPKGVDLKAMIDVIEAPVFVIECGADQRHRFLAVNDSYERLTGLVHADVRGAEPEDLFAPAEAAIANQRFATCFDRAKPVSFRETLTFDGTVLTFETSLKPVVDETLDGQRRLVGTSKHIKRVEIDTEALAFRLAQSQSALGTLEHITHAITRKSRMDDTDREALRTLLRSLNCSFEDLRAALGEADRVNALVHTSGVARARDAILGKAGAQLSGAVPLRPQGEGQDPG